MSEKKFTKFELARMKRTAQNVDQYITRKNKLATKIAELQLELNSINELIELTDAPTKAMTGGYGTEDIIKKVVTPTDKLDKNGNVIKVTTYEFLYPETIVPCITTGIDGAPAVSEAEEVESTESTGFCSCGE